MSGAAMYNPRLYFINCSAGRVGYRTECVVGPLRFWLTYLTSPWRWRIRKTYASERYNLLREKKHDERE